MLSKVEPMLLRWGLKDLGQMLLESANKLCNSILSPLTLYVMAPFCFVFFLPASRKNIESGRLSNTTVYGSYGDVDDLAAAPGGRAHHQPPSRDHGPRGAASSATWPLVPAGLPGCVPRYTWGAVCHHPVSSSGMKKKLISEKIRNRKQKWWFFSVMISVEFKNSLG